MRRERKRMEERDIFGKKEGGKIFFRVLESNGGEW